MLGNGATTVNFPWGKAKVLGVFILITQFVISKFPFLLSNTSSYSVCQFSYHVVS